MIKNSLMKFIDSCVGSIARKIEDEFRESDHPRDKGGKFTSEGGESRGEGGLHHAGKDVEKYGKDLEAKHKETVEKQKARRGSSELEETDFEKEAKKELESGEESGGEETSVKTPNAQAVEELIDTAAEGFEQNLDVVPEFVKQMGYKYSRGEKSYYEQYPRELIDVALDLIKKDPYKAHEVLGPWVDHIDLDEENDDDKGTENSAAKDVKSVRSALDEELFELATTSESEEEFKSKVKRRFDQYRMLLKQDDRLNELPVGGERAEYALKKIQSEIDSGTSEYW